MDNQNRLKGRVVDVFGSLAALARLLEIDCAMTVSQWFRPGRRVPAERCIPIARLSGGKIAPSDLRPDLYGEAEENAA